MGNGYQPELWRDAYVMLGTAAAALIGLLFVATSLHLNEIVNNPVYRIRARNNLFYLFTMVVEATLILSPQPMAFLGAELTAIALLLIQYHLRNLYKFRFKNRNVGNRGGFSIHTSRRLIASDLLCIAGGACMVKLSNWGMYLIAVSYIVFLGTIILSAWNILLGIGQADNTTSEN